MTMRMTNYDHDDFWIAELFIHLYPQIIAYWPEKFRRYSHLDLFDAKKLKKNVRAYIGLTKNASIPIVYGCVDI